MSRSQGRASKNEALSIDRDRLSGWGGCLVCGFFGLFAVAGVVSFYLMTFQPLWGVFQARSWVETPCTIASSEVVTQRGDDCDTYRIEIEYDYTFSGQQYRSDRYYFMIGSSNRRAWKYAVVEAHPVGFLTVCYVDPAEPSEAVIERGLTADMWWGLFPFPFLAVGFVPLVLILRARRNQGRQATLPTSDSLPARDGLSLRDESLSDGPVTLSPESSPFGTFIVAVLVCLFWNGIVSVFMSVVVDSWRKGDPEYFLTFFMIPFVLIGFGIIVGVVYAFVALFNPRPTLTLSRGRIPLGESAHLSWRFRGSSHSIRHMKLTLTGVEKATFRRGTDTHTDEEAFYEQMLYESDQSYEIANGEVEVEIPSDSMHTFEADNNEIIWSLQMAGDIPLRPDVNVRFPIVVTPHEMDGR